MFLQHNVETGETWIFLIHTFCFLKLCGSTVGKVHGEQNFPLNCDTSERSLHFTLSSCIATGGPNSGIRERKIPHNFHRMSLCFVSNYDLALSSIGRNSFITILLTCSQMRRQSIYVVLCRITGKHQISDMKIRIKTYIFMDKKLSFFLNMLINTYTDKRCLNVYILRFFQKYRNLSYGSKSFFSD